MKILVECFWYKEGGPYFAYGLIRGLQENGIDVYALTTDWMENKDLWSTYIAPSHIFYWNGLPQKNKPFSYIKNLLQIKKKFFYIKFDYVLITHPGRSDVIIRHFLKYKENIMILHDVVPHSSTSDNSTKYMYWVTQKADNILVLTKAYIPYVKKMFNKDKNHVFYMRHGLMSYPKIGKKTNSSYAINFLYFGRIDGYKGLDILLEGYSRISKKYENVSLRIAGNGNLDKYRSGFEKLNNVTIENRYIPDDEISSYFLVDKTVLVMPYLDATQSGVISIAYDYSIPVIATDVGGLREQLFNGQVGELCEANSSDSLYKAMEKFIVDKDFYLSQMFLMKDFRKKLEWKYVTLKFLNQLRMKEEDE